MRKTTHKQYLELRKSLNLFDHMQKRNENQVSQPTPLRNFRVALLQQIPGQNPPFSATYRSTVRRPFTGWFLGQAQSQNENHFASMGDSILFEAEQ
jgi:hypothetical protein